MKNRILVSTVILLGGLYLAVGISSFLQYRSMSEAFAYYGVSTETQISVPEIAKPRSRLIEGAIEFPLIGILVLCVGDSFAFGKAVGATSVVRISYSSDVIS